MVEGDDCLCGRLPSASVARAPVTVYELYLRMGRRVIAVGEDGAGAHTQGERR